MTDDTRPILKYRRPPAPKAETTEADRFALEWIAVRLQGDLFELGLAPLHPDTGHAFVRRVLKNYAASDEKAMLVVLDIAYVGLDDARQALIELILEYGNAHTLAPALLEEFHTRMLTGKMPPLLRGGSKADHILQDIAIVVLIGELVERFGLRPTRHKGAQRQPCAAGIVAQALGKSGVRSVTEGHLIKLWDRLSPLVGWLKNPKQQ
jgi:hypothetical protein